MSTETQDKAASGLKKGIGAIAGRFGGNVGANRAFLNNRRSGKRALQPIRIHGVRYFFVTATMVILAAVVLDLPVGSYRGQWPGEVIGWASQLTDFAQSGWILVPTGVVVLVCYLIDWGRFRARTRLALGKLLSVCAYVFLSVGVSGLIAAILKASIGRARPVHFDELGAFYFNSFTLDASFASFPSGHSTTAGALFAAIAIFFPALRLPALILGLWLGTTRILVGAHYPSDVVAGLAFGAWYAYFSALFFARYGILFTTTDSGWPVRKSGYGLLRRWRRKRG